MPETLPDGPMVQVLDGSGRGLRVTFIRQHDRYAHRIDLLDGPNVWCCLSSLEGDGDDTWPPSPPFQQLSIEERSPGHRVALLVGMAGRSHWSAGFECDPAATCLGFDLACRVHSPPVRLGSSYRTRFPLSMDAAGRAIVTAADRPVVVAIEPLSGQPVAKLDAAGDVLALAVPPAAAARSTIRWRYRISLAGTGASRA